MSRESKNPNEVWCGDKLFIQKIRKCTCAEKTGDVIAVNIVNAGPRYHKRIVSDAVFRFPQFPDNISFLNDVGNLTGTNSIKSSFLHTINIRKSALLHITNIRKSAFY